MGSMNYSYSDSDAWKNSDTWWDEVWVSSQPQPPVSPREKLLSGAIEAVTKQRNNQYGPPTQDFQRTAKLWSVLFGGEFDPGSTTTEDFEPHDVAIAMIALKLSRLTWDPKNKDSWMDIAGYAACGWECANEAA